ncbi:hypothetical protein SAMN05421770_101558 [Granulicella rosea]|uniref:Uncharacterized protein n=1 Tax=Granulicella rosea TaxID=474952 RepID=A0A239DPP8_9BACT|nr:hypothetical protein SAMN05421770_101558 [Granulicella rosea]
MNGDWEFRPGYPLADCAAAWKKHRNLRGVPIAFLVGWAPFALFVAFPVGSIFHQHGLKALLAPGILMLLYFFCFAAIDGKRLSFLCPRCGSKFYRNGPGIFGLNRFARKCRNCGLRKWQCDGPMPVE